MLEPNPFSIISLMSQTRFPSRLVAAIIVALFFGVALYLRIILPHDQVFSDGWIKFTGVDAYFNSVNFSLG